MKRIYKTYGVLLLILLTLLSGCKRQNNKEEVVYKVEMLKLEQFPDGVSNYCVEQGKLFFWLDNSDDEGNACTKLYQSNLDGTQVQEILLSEADSKKNIIDLSVNTKGNMALLLGQEIEDALEASILMLASDGQQMYEKIITESSIPSKLALCDDDCLAVISGTKLSVINQEGNLIGEEDFEFSLVDIMSFSEHRLLCAGYKTNQLVVSEWDTESWQGTSKIVLDNMNIAQSDMLMTANGYDFSVRTEKGIYGCKMDGTCEMLDDLSKMNASIDEKLVRINENNLLGLIPQTNGMIRLYQREIGTAQKRVIKVAILSEDAYNLRQNIVRFNRENDEYEVEVIDYSQSEDPVADMNCDISAGKSPDIIELSRVSISRMAQKGLLADLTPYYEKDERVSEDDLLNTVQEAMKINQKYYYVAPEFSIYTVVGKTSEVGEKKGWTFNDFYTFANGGKGDGIFVDSSIDDLLDMFGEVIISDMVDWTEQKCDFNTEEFRKLLEFCALYKNENSEMLTAHSFNQGAVSLINAKVGPLDIQYYEDLFDGDVTFIGFPNEHMMGSYFKFGNCLGILETAENKDEAWKFMSSYMTKEFQGDRENIAGMPTRKDAYQMAIKELSATTAYKDELGKEIPPFEQELYFYDYEVKLKPLSEKDVETYEALIQRTRRTSEYDSTIVDIIKDEAHLYFGGEKTVDDVIQIIQNRVSLYIAE